MKYRDYGYGDDSGCHMFDRIFPVIDVACRSLKPGASIIDLGCGNGAIAGRLAANGFRVVGLDLSETGITIARKAWPRARFEVLSAEQDVLQKLGCDPFDMAISTEVVEHLYSPRDFMKGAFAAIKPGGMLLCTTPYHGYLKNLAISLTGRWDHHADPLWDGGHIKLFSRHTLTRLFRETGFTDIHFTGIGRLPMLWMSMAISGRKPAHAV
jgi:2-polyprenyl-3-methyl-5-hydroxy-6-metoxy-1,4-benzoquinol methylase